MTSFDLAKNSFKPDTDLSHTSLPLPNNVEPTSNTLEGIFLIFERTSSPKIDFVKSLNPSFIDSPEFIKS